MLTQLRRWAARHPGRARWALAAVTVANAVLCYALGLSLTVEFGTELQEGRAWSAMLAVGGWTVAYVAQRRGVCAPRQALAGSVAACTLAWILLGAGSLPVRPNAPREALSETEWPSLRSSSGQLGSATTQHASVAGLLVLAPHLIPERAASPAWRGDLRKGLRAKIRQLRERARQRRADGGVTLAYIGVTLLIALLTLLLLSWSCSLSCNGNQAAANAVLVGGGLALVGLSVLAFLAIARWAKRRRPARGESATYDDAPDWALAMPRDEYIAYTDWLSRLDNYLLLAAVGVVGILLLLVQPLALPTLFTVGTIVGAVSVLGGLGWHLRARKRAARARRADRGGRPHPSWDEDLPPPVATKQLPRSQRPSAELTPEEQNQRDLRQGASLIGASVAAVVLSVATGGMLQLASAAAVVCLALGIMRLVRRARRLRRMTREPEPIGG